MKTRFLQQKGRLIAGLIMVSVFALAFAFQPVRANTNLEVNGTELGLEVIPQDENLFQELNMNPGDSTASKLTIKNNYVDGFDLYLRTERLSDKVSEGEPDLYEQMLMTVTFRGKVIYSGPMKSFAEENIELGSFEPGDMEEINVQVSLPGSTTGNKFMASSVENKWILTAQTDTVIIDDEDPPLGPIDDDDDIVIIDDEEVPIGPGNLPKTGGETGVYFYIGGALLIIGGMALKKKLN